MKKITQSDIENDYKEGIRKKYESEKAKGEHSHYLNNPSQALLRDLCWKIFSSNPKADDLVVYRNFFKSEFNSKEENTSTKYTDKFRKVGAFLRGEKNPANLTTAELAAIFVDFEDRPFNKFKLKGINQDQHIVISESDKPSDPEQEIKTSEVGEKKSSNEKSSEPEKEREIVDKPKSNKLRYILGTLIACLLGIAIYFACSQEQCMQWSNDHYEKVDCDLNTEGFVMSGKVERFDESKFGLKKIKVCDTTTCFINGEAIVWYAKTSSDKADFFNTHGRHPENDKPLRPVTNYIINKYGEKSVPKK